MGIFNFLKKTIKNKVVVCGLDSSGKSTIISFLQTGTFIEHTPTMGKSRSDLEVQGAKMSIFDMGGQKDFRKFWLGEMNNTKLCIFVVDISNPERFSEAKKELHGLISVIQKNKIKLIILANKVDLPHNISISKLITEFELFNFDNFEVFETSAKTGYGLADAFAKIYSILTGRIIRKNTVANAVSIYTMGGIPIITKSSNHDYERQVLQGGFLSAITTFAKQEHKCDTVSFKKPILATRPEASFDKTGFAVM